MLEKNMEKREIGALIIAFVLMAILLAFNGGSMSAVIFFNAVMTALLIIFVSVFSKKLIAYRLDEKVEIKIWELQRYGLAAKQHWKSPVPLGLIIPIVFSLLSAGFIKFLTILQFDYKALPSKVVKRYGMKRFSGTMEWDGALIAFYSFLSVLALSFVSSIIFGSSDLILFKDLAKYSFYYSLYNLIPFGQLDGSRIFFGSRPLYIFSLVVAAIFGLAISANIFF